MELREQHPQHDHQQKSKNLAIGCPKGFEGIHDVGSTI
jgi:hypothetical protein